MQGRTSCKQGDPCEAASTSGEEEEGPVWCASKTEEIGRVSSAERFPAGCE